MGREPIVKAWFPNLSSLTVTSAATGSYNCIAWAFGDNERWWWPSDFTFWPTQHNNDVVGGFQLLFDTLKAELTSSEEVESGYLKVALYVKDGVPTHAARLLEDGLWTSKLGKEDDIAHDLKGLEGNLYGQVVQVFRIKL